jgi:hypothetical protein
MLSGLLLYTPRSIRVAESQGEEPAHPQTQRPPGTFSENLLNRQMLLAHSRQSGWRLVSAGKKKSCSAFFQDDRQSEACPEDSQKNREKFGIRIL